MIQDEDHDMTAAAAGLGLPGPAQHLRRPGQRARARAARPAARPAGRDRRGELRPAGAARRRHLPDGRRRGPAADAGHPAAARGRRAARGGGPRRGACSRSARATRCSAWSSAARTDAPVPGLGLLDIRSGRGERARRRRDRRRRRPRAERATADRVREPPGRHQARPAAPGRWPAPRSAPATAGRHRGRLRRAGCSARTCTARRSSATPASPTCCCYWAAGAAAAAAAAGRGTGASALRDERLAAVRPGSAKSRAPAQ